ATAATTPRFDAFLTAAEHRRDDWQRLQGLAQAWAAVATSGDDGAAAARQGLVGEAQDLLARLEPLETLWAFPGPALIRKLRDKLGGGDPAGSAELARRLAKAVL